MPATITIITSTFNCRDALRDTAASIRAQTMPELQWIIADGASTDGTLEVIEANRDIVSHWFSDRDRGIYDAWNKASPYVRGDWVLFLGAGDLLLTPDSLRRAAGELSRLSNTLLAYGGVVLVDDRGQPVQYEREVDFSRWHQGRPALPCHQGVFQYRSLFEARQPFDSSLLICADAKLMLQAVAMAPPVYLRFDITKMAVGGISTTPRGWMTMARENGRICEDLGLRPPLLHRLGMIRLHTKLLAGMILGRHVGTAANAYRRLTGRKPIY